MPLTEFQREVFATLRLQRSPDSFVFGATVLHAAKVTPRFSQDIGLCHDTAAAVAATATADTASLLEAGYEVTWQLQQPTFQQAVIARGEDSVKLEWVYDSAWRFYPVEPDPELGYRLHYFDAATNKLLALSGQAEPRDFVDLHLDASYLSLGTLAWAAAGKDGGLNPLLILELAARFARYRQSDIDSLHLSKPLILPDLKLQWLEALAAGRRLIDSLPAEESGCAYLDPNSKRPVIPDPSSPDFPQLIRHFGSLGGTWPIIAA